MASNSLKDLNDMFFNELVRLDDDDISDDKLKKEISRAKAMNSIGQTLVDNARVVLDAAKFMDQREDPNSELPRMIGISDPEKKKRVSK